jgi:hypothetical protein
MILLGNSGPRRFPGQVGSLPLLRCWRLFVAAVHLIVKAEITGAGYKIFHALAGKSKMLYPDHRVTGRIECLSHDNRPLVLYLDRWC